MSFENDSDFHEKLLVEQFNDEFTRTVLPVTVFVGVEIIIGFFGNLLILYVFLFRYHVCNFRYFVLCLAFTDILSTVTTMPGEVLTQLKWYVYPVREICKIKSFFNMFTVMSEAFCLLTIAVDRYRKICVPFGWQIRPNIALILCGMIFGISAIIAFPVPFLWGTRQIQKVYNNTNITVTICEKDENQAYTRHVFQYTTAVYVVSSILLTSLFVLYTFVARTLALQGHMFTSLIKKASEPSSSLGESSEGSSYISSEASKSRSKTETSDLGSPDQDAKLKAFQCCISTDRGLTTGDDKEERPISIVLDTASQQPITPQEKKRKTRTQTPKRSKLSEVRLRRKTRIMFILTLIFTITTVCYLTLLSLIANDDVLQEMSDTGRAFYFFFFRLYFINHVINPFVYTTLDPHFKREMKKLKHLVCRKIFGLIHRKKLSNFTNYN